MIDKPLDYSALPDVSAQHPELGADELWFAAHMTARERALTAVFGSSVPAGQIMVPVDPNLMLNWPGGGVYTYPPTAARKAWHYVTHGLAQPASENDAVSAPPGEEPISGWGIELVIATPDNCAWARDVLLNLVKYLLFDKNSRVILPGDRLPCNGPLVLETDTPIRHLIAVRSAEYQSDLMLPAGACMLVHMIGVTDGEIAKAKAWGIGSGGTLILQRVLEVLGVGYCTDPDRSCLTLRPDFEAVWSNCQSELESVWLSHGWEKPK